MKSVSRTRILGGLALCLLAGCIPGALTSQQPAARSAITPAVSPEPYPPRPVLFYGQVKGEWGIESGIVGVDPSGRQLGLVAEGQLLGWSRQGDRFAYFEVEGGMFEAKSLAVMRLGEPPVTIMRPSAGELLFPVGQQSVWSPDGTQLVILVKGRQGLEFAILAADGGQIIQRFPLPVEAYTGDSSLCPSTLKWSPDGQKILLAWEQTLAVDVTNGTIEVLAASPTRAEWLPGSDAIVYFPVMGPPELYRVPLGGGEVEEVLDQAQLAGWGLEETIWLVKLSPSGNYLALAGVTRAGGDTVTTVILNFAVRPAQGDIWDSPAQKLSLSNSGVLALEWGPDEQEVAVLRMSGAGLTVDLLRLADGATRTLANVVGIEGAAEFLDVAGLANWLSWVP